MGSVRYGPGKDRLKIILFSFNARCASRKASSLARLAIRISARNSRTSAERSSPRSVLPMPAILRLVSRNNSSNAA